MTLTSLKYLVRKNKNQSGLKKMLREMQKPLWFETNRKEFEELTRDIYNNQDNKDFKIIITKELMIWKMENFLDGSNYTKNH